MLKVFIITQNLDEDWNISMVVIVMFSMVGNNRHKKTMVSQKPEVYNQSGSLHF